MTNRELEEVISVGRNVLRQNYKLKRSTKTSFYSRLSSSIRAIFAKKTGGEFNKKFERVLLEGWIEELLRFLAILSLSGKGGRHNSHDFVPSYPVWEAWRCLMADKRLYCKVCLALGNSGAIDPDDFTVKEEDDLRALYEDTVKEYKRLYHSEPPYLFWPEFDDFLYENEGCLFDTIIASDTWSFLVEALGCSNALQGSNVKSWVSSHKEILI
uniref:Uncharacterized protein n=1 Tax=Leptocylindrus danicus TaxID=163516 RepID=A0A6U2LL51_9STRA|mmetsp:Transcript_11047/g.16707  ORF Transcript_11047/g.16707 Transcript_11047/m.16707 type:complete len:213 (+) Transcript_11047:128-766(+)|eukprot:CAMPEP_0116018910 /NCGR_PEP_ID=MMETSP0321-20121206/8921_1 /TAXON_ID=163516 /ORGANISM="Leptocylindrus danicus var. danicus, Strain B650" /LENGTH=212 /DNA_ID=CAMNT_0003489377 /DNA_START=126 /DNA_END=764 /DNA_ORIENTATION=+